MKFLRHSFEYFYENLYENATILQHYFINLSTISHNFFFLKQDANC